MGIDTVKAAHKVPGFFHTAIAARLPRSLARPGSLRAYFREGRTEADISCPVEVGAGLTVKERSNGGIRFEKFTAFDAARVAEAAE